MRTNFTGTAGTDWQLTGGTYRFSGPPNECTGTLSLRNLSTRRVRIRRLETLQPSRVRKGYKALPPTRVRLRVNLTSDIEVQASARLELPEHLPTGRYLAHLKAGDEKSTLEVDVEATRLLELDPEDHVLVGRAGETVTFSVNLFNAGNTPIEIQRLTPVWLTEEGWTERILVSALQDNRDADDFVTFAQRLLDRARQEIPAPAQLTAEPQPEITLAAGDSVDLTITLALPDNLLAGREYRGFIRINEEKIELEVYCSGQAGQAPTGTSAAEAHER